MHPCSDSASCSVELFLEGDGGVEVVLQRTLSVQSGSVYEVNGETMAEVDYKARLRELHLQAAAVILPQRYAGAPVQTEPYGFGKYFESFCDFFNEREFSEADEDALRASNAKISQLERRIATCQRTIDQITSLRPAGADEIQDIQVNLREKRPHAHHGNSQLVVHGIRLRIFRLFSKGLQTVNDC